jgi:hypothetical protein
MNIKALSALISFCLLALAAGAAEEIPPPKLSPPDSWLPRAAGTVRVLNKIDSTVQTIHLTDGQTVQVQFLSIKLSSCFVRPPDLPADAAAHLTITDSRPGTPGFDGWMLQKEPAINMLEHPVYDVQLVSCG